MSEVTGFFSPITEEERATAIRELEKEFAETPEADRDLVLARSSGVEMTRRKAYEEVKNGTPLGQKLLRTYVQAMRTGMSYIPPEDERGF